MTSKLSRFLASSEIQNSVEITILFVVTVGTNQHCTEEYRQTERQAGKDRGRWKRSGSAIVHKIFETNPLSPISMLYFATIIILFQRQNAFYFNCSFDVVTAIMPNVFQNGKKHSTLRRGRRVVHSKSLYTSCGRLWVGRKYLKRIFRVSWRDVKVLRSVWGVLQECRGVFGVVLQECLGCV